jgi:MaoC like domain
MTGDMLIGTTHERTMKYWEDLVSAPPRRFGPVVFTSELLDQLLDLMGEKHPVHDSDAFAALTSRRQRIVPGGFIHSITSGWTVQHGSPAAVVGMRSLSWDFVRPLYPDTPFYFTTESEHAEEIDDRLGLVNSVRRVFDDADRVYAIGRMSVVMLRRRAVQDQPQSQEESVHARRM